MEASTQAATILTALRDIINADVLEVESYFKTRSVAAIDGVIRELIASGLVDRTQIDSFNSVKEYRSDFVHAIFGKDHARSAQQRGVIDI